MKQEIEIIVREAVSADSQALIDFLNKVGAESHYLTLDEAGILLSADEMAEYLEQIAQKDNNAYFLALTSKAEEKLTTNHGVEINGQKAAEIVGVLSVTADFHYRVRHIGDIFIAITEEYQGLGIGTLLFQDMLDWVQERGVIKRLELTCQRRNTAAVHLYKKMGFTLEAIKLHGARDEKNQLIDTLQMVRLFK